MAPKRKISDAEAPSTKKAKVGGTTPKTIKKAKKTTKLNGNVKKKIDAGESLERPKRGPKRINKLLKAKVDQIHDFNNSTDFSLLKRHSDNENHVIIPAADLLGALLAMHVDWQLSDPRMAHLGEVKDAIVKEYNDQWPTSDEIVKIVVLDLERNTTFVQGIQQKVAGHGLDGMNLLEIELERKLKADENAAGFRLYKAVNEAPEGTDDDNSAEDKVEDKVKDKVKDEVEDKVEEVKKSKKAALNGDQKEQTEKVISKSDKPEKEGVCPRPVKEL